MEQKKKKDSFFPGLKEFAKVCYQIDVYSYNFVVCLGPTFIFVTLSFFSFVTFASFTILANA